ncbi:MAG TPA: erythromycin esterase family protein [Thermoanaerobaculia bacterium]|nr:erythromycin esterase family protein [Thermoanaerobaculia bacterium]
MTAPRRRSLLALLLLLAACRSSSAPPRAALAPSADCLEGSASDDPRVRWLAEHAIRVRSVDPADDDFADLQPLKDVLRDARVVLLGEQSHGEGTVFLAKARLIAFLHHEMGFDVLAFESGLFDCAVAWERLRAGEAAATAVPRCVFPIWTRSAEVQPLIAYLGEQARGPRPLELAGFDNQFTGSASRERLVADLRALLDRLGAPFAGGPEWEPFAAQLQALAENLYPRGKAADPPEGEQALFLRRLETVRAEVAARGAADDPETAFWLQVLEGVGPAARQAWLYDPATQSVGPEIGRLRDTQMGRNLVWLADRRYPGRKIVGWAATYHAARELGPLEPEEPGLADWYRQVTVMGEVAAQELGDALYTLGFTAYEGAIATPFEPQPEPVAPASAGTLEDLMRRACLEHAIVDLRRPPAGGEWLRRPLVSRPLGHQEMRAAWGEVVDGLMFSRAVAPSTPAVERTP